MTLTAVQPYRGLIETYRRYLPVSDETPIVSLNEGNTPLIEAPALNRRLGRGMRVRVKYEGLNPTGSFKDRGMTMAITKAVEAGSQAVICASTGNTSASMAAYAARAGLRSFLLVPDGYVAAGKLAQATVHGATVVAIKGNFDQALDLVRRISGEHPVTLVNSVNPFRIEGQKTAAFEVCDQLGRAPDVLAIPVGNAGNITAYWKGFNEYQQGLPRMWGFQAAGAAPMVGGAPVAEPKTLATAIRIGNPAGWQPAEAAVSHSGGLIQAVSDEEIVAAYQLLAREVGVFCEPASAASVAGLLKYGHQLPDEADVVCVLTGHGLKDPGIALETSAPLPPAVAAEYQAVLGALELR